ncbi:MAG: sensor histidine kinase [Spirochaetota bacterium]
MDFLDMRTVMFSHLLIDLVCTFVVIALWLQNRRRFQGTGLWAINFILQTSGITLILLRGVIPDSFSVILANMLIVGGMLLGYLGLARFTEQRPVQAHNYIIFAAYGGILYYFTYVIPDTFARIILFSAILLAYSLQYAWLTLLGVGREKRAITRPVGLIFCCYCLVSSTRMIGQLALPRLESDFLHSGYVDTLFVIAYQLLFVLFTYSLSFMINKRLYLDLQKQEEKFAKAFHSSPYAVALSRLSDGTLFEVNAGFEDISGYRAAEVVGKTTIDLGLWADENDRMAVTEKLSRNTRVRDVEIQFRKKTGDAVIGLLSAETIMVDGRPSLLSSISDITERKKSEEKIRALLAEKELILVEVHHRVKNNLSAIFSLLNLQASSHGDRVAAGVLHDAANRVRSMMVLYDKLYKSEDVTEIPLNRYLPPLVHEIIDIFPAKAAVRIETDVGEITVGAKTASTLGIIINELVTNAMKYAVGDRENALLQLSATERNGTVLIEFGDDGPGLPESVTIENSTGFGMQLVGMLVHQLGGSVRIERQGGTRFMIEFRE